MKVRNIVAVGALLAMLVPTAGRADHCDIPIYLFSSTRIQTDVDDPANPGQKIGRGVPSAVSSAIGCTVIRDTVLGQEDPTLHDAYDTDYVYPGSNRFSVRLLSNGNDPAIIESATLLWRGETIDLAMATGRDVTGAPGAPWLDSQTIIVDSADTATPGQDAVVTIVLTTAAGGDTFTRTYRTVG